ncbi:hypothetical protein TSOC_000713 [Tetrabaena socialis]|uniref:Uncharacterized protein n=1 Tax=Tetrabaena socialis TaxID=47790 RepID=A0A2J8AIK5_9CHLO|nr:hypothetical protein TSOC_000713 [Tetrabaena socialis]|eukprot:PNH12349.1 hypothetical protein TSOC_000713 [Tetrabaena socialis]
MQAFPTATGARRRRSRSGLAPMTSSSLSITGMLPPPAAASSAAVPGPSSLGSDVAEYGKLVVGLGSLYALDMAIKQAFTAVGIVFPSALGGMFGVVMLLLAVGDSAASAVIRFYSPALNWIAKWLPLFYVASLVTLPLALKGIANSELIKIMIILSTGMVATLLFTAQEPEALPFCALSYSLVGILSTFLAATPLVRNTLLGIVG